MTRRAKVLLWACSLIVAVVASIGLYGLFSTSVLQVKTLHIEARVEEAALKEVRETLRPVLNGNLVTLDIDTVRERLLSLDWVRDVTVTRQWPDAMHLRIERHTPVAIWDEGRLVSDRGVVFSSTDESIETLMELPVFNGDITHVARAVALLPEFQRAAERMGAKVKVIGMSYRGSWSVRLETDALLSVDIELGRLQPDQDIVARLNRVADHFAQISDNLQGYPARIDARYRNAFAVRLPDGAGKAAWKQLQTPADEQP